MTDIRVCVVVVVFHPDADAVRRIEGLLGGPLEVVVVNDGSPDPPELAGSTDYVQLGSNRGIASALNRGLTVARDRGSTHVVTLDQDSVVDDVFVKNLLAWWEEAEDSGLRPGIVAPRDVTGIVYRGRRAGSFLAVPEAMQSGSMFEVSQLLDVGGFDESLVIDTVDTDMSLRLADAGFDVLVAPLEMRHQVGEARSVHVAGRSILVTNHPPFRYYYMTRNRLLLARARWRRDPTFALRMLRRTAVALVFVLAVESDRRRKSAAIWLGFRHAIRGVRGQLAGGTRSRWS